jgi:hypothetical protein
MASTRNRRIVYASGAGLAQRGIQPITTLITLPSVLHALGVAEFGIWGAATSLAWLSGMLDLGLGSALVTLIPRSIAGIAPGAKGQTEPKAPYPTKSLAIPVVYSLTQSRNITNFLVV